MASVVVGLLLTLQFREAARAASAMGAGCRRQGGGVSAVLTELRAGDWSILFVIGAGVAVMDFCCHHPRARLDMLGMPNDRRVNALMFLACVVGPAALALFVKSACLVRGATIAWFVVSSTRMWKVYLRNWLPQALRRLPGALLHLPQTLRQLPGAVLQLPAALLQLLFLFRDIGHLLGPLVRPYVPSLLTPATVAKLRKLLVCLKLAPRKPVVSTECHMVLT